MNQQLIIEDLDFVRETIRSLIKGQAFVKFINGYYFIGQVINRKSGNKIEVEVHKDAGFVTVEDDLINMETFLVAARECWDIDYTITYEFKKAVPKLILKLDIGVEKDNSQQTLVDHNGKVTEMVEDFMDSTQKIVDKSEGIDSISISSPSFENGKEIVIAKKGKK